MYTFKNRSNKDILSDRTIRRRAAARAQELLHSKRRKTIDINEPYTEPQYLDGVNEQCSHTRDIHIQLEDTYTDHDSSIDDRESFVHVDENLSVRENATKYRDAHFEMETYTSAMDSDTDLSSVVSDVSHDADESPFKERLREWVVNSKTPLVHTNSLLSLLKPHCPSLPKDARTLLQTEKVYTIEDRAGGKYHHFGIMEGLLHELKNDDKLCKCSNLSLQIGIDGLPLFKSSNESFWPILCIVKEKINAEPFIIGLWVGSSKPTDPNDYLEPFICEMGCLMENGLTFHGKDYTVSVKNFVCDTSARSFIKFTKGNTGYHGCDFCECRGRYFMNRVTFPDMNSPARTDEAFASMQCSEHHRGQSDLQNLDIGMVTCFPLSPYLTGMETSWRPVGDSSLRGSRRRRRDVSWRFGGSRGSRSEIKHVRFFLRLFGDFFKSPVGLGDVAATSQRLNMFSRRNTSPRRLSDVSATSPRPPRPND